MTIGVQHGRLLRAALLEGPAAVDEWRRWRDSVELDDIDWPSMRLVPLLWHNLLAAGVKDPLLTRYRTVYRHTWLSNQVRLSVLRRVEATLAQAGVELLALKGVALAHGYYPSAGLRPMDDLDILVRPPDLPAAVDALRSAGWQAHYRRPERVLRVVHGQELRDAAGERLDLHGHVFQGSLHTVLDAQRWARAEVLPLPDGPLRVLAPTDQLLHVLVHGAESDPPAPRWLADAAMVLRGRGADIDWSRLVDDAEAESRGLAVAASLAELRRLLPGESPAPVTAALAMLSARPRSYAERFEQRVAAGWRLFAVRHLVERAVDHRRWRRALPVERRRVGFVAYMRLNWDLDSMRQLPGQVVGRGLRTLAGDVRRLTSRRGLQRATEPSPPRR